MKIKPKSSFLCEQFSVRGSVMESGDGTRGLAHAAQVLCHLVTVPAPAGTVLTALSLLSQIPLSSGLSCCHVWDPTLVTFSRNSRS